jgi:hypothetical protein
MNKRTRRKETASKGCSAARIWRVVCSYNRREATAEMGVHRGAPEQPQARCKLLK